MPALAVAFDLPVRDELGHHAVQVIRLDLERLGDLRNRDPRLLAHELERLVRPGAVAAAASRTAGTTTAAPARRGCSRPRRPTRSTTSAEQCGAGGLKPRYLFLERAQPLVDVLHRTVNEFWQWVPPRD